MSMQEKTIIGRTATAQFPGDGARPPHVPVKVDTGADRSSVWASNLHVDTDNVLHFTLFAEGSPYYSGATHQTRDFSVQKVRSSNGVSQIRYRVMLSIRIDGRRVKGSFTLADRSKNTYPVLIGCTLLRGRFLVDVTQESSIAPVKRVVQDDQLLAEFDQSPKDFFDKYHRDN